MNVKVLDKIESAWVCFDWKVVVNRVQFTNDHLDTLIGMIENFYKNRGAKELVVFKYQRLPAYAVLPKSEYGEFLDWLQSACLPREMYEDCVRIQEIKGKL
jgi:hypothetical protein